MNTLKGESSCDLLILSLATTAGLHHADRLLAAEIEKAGATCKVAEVEIGLSGKLRQTMLLTDAVEACAARSTLKSLLKNEKPRSVILSTVTAALLQPTSLWDSYRTAVRFDSPASLNRPGRINWPQHRLERLIFNRADMLLPLGEQAVRASGCEEKSIVLPPPIDVEMGPEKRENLAVAYAGNPKKRGLDLLCEAWQGIQQSDIRLLVTGIDEADAKRWLKRCGQDVPENTEFVGLVERDTFQELLKRSRFFLNASRWEDFGVAQLEALSSGALLVTLPSPGANEALPLAAELAPALVSPDMSVRGLVGAFSSAMQMGRDEITSYRSQADDLLKPFRAESVQRTISETVLPRLLP